MTKLSDVQPEGLLESREALAPACTADDSHVERCGTPDIFPLLEKLGRQAEARFEQGGDHERRHPAKMESASDA